MRMRFNRNRLFALAVLCLLAAQYVPAQSPGTPAQSPQQIAAKVGEYMDAAVRINRFSGSILMARDGQPVISKGYGMANYELDVPNTPQTVFRLGSLTKPFTAAAIMMLQERGKLNTVDLQVSERLSGDLAARHHPPPSDPHLGHPGLYGHACYRETQVAAPDAGRAVRVTQG